MKWVNTTGSAALGAVLGLGAPAHAAELALNSQPGGPPAGKELRHEEVEGAKWLEGNHATGNWFGLRDELVERGITFEGFVIADWSLNFHGGLNTDTDAFRHLLDVNLTIDTERLLGWKGGTLFIDFQNFNGRNGSEILTGDLQGLSNIDADGFTQVAELWYEQVLMDERLRVKVGKVDANTEFALAEHAGEFINSSHDYSPTILGFPSYPDPATSINLLVYPAEWLYAGVGVYDGATQDDGFGRTGNRGPETFFGRPGDLFLVGEAGFLWMIADRLPGRTAVGLWRHTGTFERLGPRGGAEDGTSGFYIVLDQLITRESSDNDDGQGIGVFLQLGWADERVAEMDLHVGAGLAWTGAIPGRDRDVLGIMASYVHLSDDARAAGLLQDDYELVIESFYKVQITPWFSIKPDVQYIVNPGGTGLEDALVATLRMELTF